LYQELRNAAKVVAQLEEYNLWSLIEQSIDKSKLITTKKIEILSVYVHGYALECPDGKLIRYHSYGVGYVMCGPASRCQCIQQQVAQKVAQTKSKYSEDIKNQIAEKRANTNIEKYGVANLFEDSERIQDSVHKKYGVHNVNHLAEVRDKIKQTNINRYGGNAPIASVEVKEKMKQTSQQKYGTDYPTQSPQIKYQQQQTMIDRYGAPFPIQNAEIAARTRLTNMSRYGFDNAAKHDVVKEKIRKATRSAYLENLVARLDPFNIRPVGAFDRVSDHKDWVCDVCQTTFEGTAWNGRVPRCPTCFPASVSGPQKEIIDYVTNLVGLDNIVVNDRKLLENRDDRRRSLEIDILMPQYNLGIEYCGLKYHTEISGGKTINYHHNKFNMCKERGIQLITVWSDEWYGRRALLKSMIATRLGLGNKIHARQLIGQKINPKEARTFFETNHIQGYVGSKHNYGLFDVDNNLLMCLSVSKPRYSKNYDFEITRLASQMHTVVVGGASKLFNMMCKDLNPQSVISYCDLRYGTGKVYSQLGFLPLGLPTIGYEYIEMSKPNKRYNRLACQKHMLGDTNGLGAKEYLHSIGFERVYDCGQQKFVWLRP
jgi:hypothetical protein